MQQSSKERRRRLVTFAAVATLSMSMFVAMGGAGLAQSAISLVQYQYGKKVLICHKGKQSIKISTRSWRAHKRHGDTEGACVKKKHDKKHRGEHGRSGDATTENAAAENARGKKGRSEHGKSEHGSAISRQGSVGTQTVGFIAGSGERGGKGRGDENGGRHGDDGGSNGKGNGRGR